jgi:hypothetical protein
MANKRVIKKRTSRRVALPPITLHEMILELLSPPTGAQPNKKTSPKLLAAGGKKVLSR